MVQVFAVCVHAVPFHVYSHVPDVLHGKGVVVVVVVLVVVVVVLLLVVVVVVQT